VADVNANKINSPIDLHFNSDQPLYLLFLKNRSDGNFTTRRCFGSRFLGAGLTTPEQNLLGHGQTIK
jgi:hypothetical protein